MKEKNLKKKQWLLKIDKFPSCDDLVSPMHILYSIQLSLHCLQYKVLSILLKFFIKVTGAPALSCRTLPHGDTSAWNHYRTSFNQPLRN